MIKPIRTTGTLISKRFITETVLELQYKTPEDIPWQAGQHATISVTTPFSRPYSIVDSKDSVMTFMVEVRDPGMGADFFRAAEIGSTTQIMAPLGRFLLQETNIPKVFISTGAGAAPFIPMIKQALSNGPWAMRNTEQANAHSSQPIAFFQGMRFQKDDLPIVYLKDEIETDLVDYYRCITREEITLDEQDKIKFRSGRVTKVVPEMNFDWGNTEFYLCGSNEMGKEMRTILQEKGADKIYIENYG